MTGDDQRGAVHVYVDPATHHAFEEYRKQVGLKSESSLVCLLVDREFKVARLASAPPTAPTGSSKISAYLGPDRKAALQEHAPALHPRVAVSHLIRRELEEEWLLKALEWIPQ